MREERLKAAFDLATDPQEREDLLEKDGRPAQLGRKHISRIAERLRGTAPVEPLPEGAMDDGGLRKRRESGYGGDR
jgi:hypothetical protein